MLWPVAESKSEIIASSYPIQSFPMTASFMITVVLVLMYQFLVPSALGPNVTSGQESRYAKILGSENELLSVWVQTSFLLLKKKPLLSEIPQERSEKAFLNVYLASKK